MNHSAAQPPAEAIALSTPPAYAADVDAARSGDRAAFARLYERFAPAVHAVALAHAPHPPHPPRAADAEDVTQETFSHALAALPQLRDPLAFPGWILAIARNAAKSRLRQSPPRPLPENLPRRDNPAPDLEAADAALDAIGLLPETYRETLLMRLVAGLTGPQIAERTGLTEGSVRVNLSRGMALLKQALAGRNP